MTGRVIPLGRAFLHNDGKKTPFAGGTSETRNTRVGFRHDFAMLEQGLSEHSGILSPARGRTQP